MVRIRLSRPLCRLRAVFFMFSCDQSKLALGWRKKKLSVKVFSTTGAVLLFCKQASARRGKSYKTSDRSELATAYKAELMSQKRKKKLSVKVFSTTGAVLLFCKQASARRGKSYKTSDRSELATACKAELMSQTRCRWFESVCPDHCAAFGRFFYAFITAGFSGRRNVGGKEHRLLLTETAFPMSGHSQLP